MKKRAKTFLDYLYIVIGNALAAFSISVFFNPASLAPGGVSGISIIINHLTGWNLGLTMLVINIPIYIAGLLVFGKEYGFKTLISTVLLSLFTSMWSWIFPYGILDYHRDMSFWLSALFGGLISGAGTGITMRSGSNTGGTDILAQIFARFTPLQTGVTMMIINGAIIFGSLFVFGVESALYSVSVCLLTSVIIDKVIMLVGTGYAKTVFIISPELEAIGSWIIETLHHSGTIIESEGLYSKSPRPMLMAIIPNKDLPRLTREIREIDPNAFVIIQNTSHVLGQGYRNISLVADNQDPTQDSENKGASNALKKAEEKIKKIESKKHREK